METMTNRELEAALVLQHLQLTTPSAPPHWGAKKRRMSPAPSANLAGTTQHPRSPAGRRESSPATSGEAAAVLKPTNSAAGGSPVSPFLFDQFEKGEAIAARSVRDGSHDSKNRTAQLAKLGRFADLQVVDPTAYAGDLGDLSPRFWSLGGGGGGSGVVDPSACFGCEFGVVVYWPENEKKAAAAEARRRRVVEIKRRKAAAAAVAVVCRPSGQGQGSSSSWKL